MENTRKRYRCIFNVSGDKQDLLIRYNQLSSAIASKINLSIMSQVLFERI